MEESSTSVVSEIHPAGCRSAVQEGEGGREGGREGEREGGREGEREGGREGERENQQGFYSHIIN